MKNNRVVPQPGDWAGMARSWDPAGRGSRESATPVVTSSRTGSILYLGAGDRRVTDGPGHESC